MFSAVMTVLFALVMVYVWQHFSAIDIGYKVEAQKTQIEQLREQNRQLRLTEAQLTEPARIDILARQLGLDVPQPGQVIRTEGFTGRKLLRWLRSRPLAPRQAFSLLNLRRYSTPQGFRSP